MLVSRSLCVKGGTPQAKRGSSALLLHTTEEPRVSFHQSLRLKHCFQGIKYQSYSQLLTQ